MKTLLSLFLVLFAVCGFSQESIKRNYFTTNQNPQLNITNGNLISTNIYVSNIFATNITVNEFRGRTTITTNLFVTNSLIQFLTNNYFYTTNVTEQFVTNQLSYITNLYGPFITNNNLYSTNIFTTNLFATYVTNNTDYITNLYGPFITNDTIYTTNIFNSTAYVTNLYGPFITNFQLYSTDIFVTNLTANYITNLQDITTNLFVSNAFFTNLTVEFITNDFLFVTNFYNSNAFITNLTANYITNNTSYTTNLISSNIFTTNIFVMEASWFTNKWNGPTNDVSFTATYQNFVASGDMEITGFRNSIATNANTSVLLLDPGGATRTLYFPAPWTNFTSDGNNAYVIPKTNTAIVTLFQYGNLYTNVVVRLFGPGTGTPAPVAQVWSNYQGFIFPAGEPAPDTGGNLKGPSVFFRGDGSLFQGTNVMKGLAPATSFAYVPGAVSMVTSNDPGEFVALWDVMDDSDDLLFESFSKITTIGDKDNGSVILSLSASITNGLFDAFSVILDPAVSISGTDITLKTNGTSIFNVEKHGQLTANAFTDKSFAANGVVTNDSTGLLHTTPVLPSTLLPTDLAYTDKNNAFTTASSNYFAGAISISTNSCNGVPDFSVEESLFSTNNAIVFAAPIGVDSTKKTVQWLLVNTTNTTAAAVTVTPPANCHGVGTLYCTNWSQCWFQCYGGAITNMIVVPIF